LHFAQTQKAGRLRATGASAWRLSGAYVSRAFTWNMSREACVWETRLALGVLVLVGGSMMVRKSDMQSLYDFYSPVLTLARYLIGALTIIVVLVLVIVLVVLVW